jgi:hypothetical protein
VISFGQSIMIFALEDKQMMLCRKNRLRTKLLTYLIKSIFEFNNVIQKID